MSNNRFCRSFWYIKLICFSFLTKNERQTHLSLIHNKILQLTVQKLANLIPRLSKTSLGISPFTILLY